MSNDKEQQQQPSMPSQQDTLVLPDQVLPPNLFILPLQSSVIYPTLMAPVVVTMPRFVATVEEVVNRQRLIGILLTKEGAPSESTKLEDLYQTGVVVKILKRIKMPDGGVNLLVHSIKRFKVGRILSDKPHVVVEANYVDDEVEESAHMDALARTVMSHVKKLAETNPFFTQEMRLAMINAPGNGAVADLVAFALSLDKSQAQEILETASVRERFEKLLVHLRKEQDLADLQKKIQEDVNGKINTMQREYFLKEQLKVIKKELGIEEDDRSKSGRKFRERIEEAGMPEDAKSTALEELKKFETLSEQSPEYNISRSYLETICSLPWSNSTEDQLDTEHARKILDEDHYGIEFVKDRIIEFLSIRQLIGKESTQRGSIICLVGPPGVGKTSVGKSIARALGRKFYRFSLGGMRDEAEIKGHRRTYIGALPGKVIQAMKRAGSHNPVLVLDEIDKLGTSFQGDPASALLEVLDPEQNNAFLDHYLDIPFDLSKVLFIATANNISTIPAPLLDRMEIIEMPGYTLEEKEKISQQYVIPNVLKKNGLKPKQISLDSAALRGLLSDYAREPGLRSLQQLIERIARKAAAQIVKSKKALPTIAIRKDDLPKWVGPQRFYNEVAERIRKPGIVVGLAWTAAGGDILFVEAAETPGSGNLRLTGNLGEVMEESAQISWSVTKQKLFQEYGYTQDFFKNKDIHLHLPAGAVPKDGPSAGITMAAAFYSLLSGKVSRQWIAMTGELSLTGKVLPVGGIKEKLLAAKRAGIKEVILPALNKKDLIEIPDYALKGLTLHWVSDLDQVFQLLWQKNSPKTNLKYPKNRRSSGHSQKVSSAHALPRSRGVR